MCENINITGWLLACISGLLWYVVSFQLSVEVCCRTEAYGNSISAINLDNFMSEVNRIIPADSPARRTSLAGNTNALEKVMQKYLKLY